MPGLVSARPWVLAVLVGLLQALSIAWPGPDWTPWLRAGQALWWLQILSLALLVRLLLAAPTHRRAAALGWCFATAWLAGSFWWLFISMHRYGGLAAPLALLALLGLAAFLGSYYALASAVFWRLRHVNTACAAIFFAAAWLLAELARGQWWTGFPWGAGGYAHVDGPLAALARWVGVYGVGAVAAALSVWLARGLRLRRAQLLSAGAVLWLLLGAHWQRQQQLAAPPDSAPLTVALLQGNIPQDEKFQPGSGVPQALAWYGEQIRQAQAQLVVAPETAIPLLPGQLLPGYLSGLTQRYTQAQGAQALLLGMPLGDERSGYTNSALGFAPEQPLAQPYRYDKQHLVPFGEFIPPLFRWFTELMQIPLGDFSRGAAVQAPLLWQGQRIAPNICYEDLFGEELAAPFGAGQAPPSIMVNLSNIAWFGDSVAIEQHLNISRMRALEFERPQLRATNTGATALIDERAQVLQLLPAQRRAVLHASVQGRQAAVTPYVWWVARWGLWPLWLLAAALLAWGLLGRERRLTPGVGCKPQGRADKLG